jgi:hypothetical protein
MVTFLLSKKKKGTMTLRTSSEIEAESGHEGEDVSEADARVMVIDLTGDTPLEPVSVKPKGRFRQSTMQVRNRSEFLVKIRDHQKQQRKRQRVT